jgi:hypothetical protein
MGGFNPAWFLALFVAVVLVMVTTGSLSSGKKLALRVVAVLSFAVFLGGMIWDFFAAYELRPPFAPRQIAQPLGSLSPQAGVTPLAPEEKKIPPPTPPPAVTIVTSTSNGANVISNNSQTPVVENKDSSVNINQTNPHNSPPIIGHDNTVTINPDVNPNASVTTYYFNGDRRVTNLASGSIELQPGAKKVELEAIAKLEKAQNWVALRDFCEEETKKTPEWLTPPLLAGEAYANLGDIDKAIERLDYVHQKAGGWEEFSVADRLREEIRRKTGK